MVGRNKQVGNFNKGKKLNEAKQEDYRKFIELFVAIEQAMEPLKEARRELRKGFSDDDRLTRGEMAHAVRAYRFLEKEVDIEEFNDVHDIIDNLLITMGKVS